VSQLSLKSEQDLQTHLLEELDTAEAKAWDSLARYKFQMFGYWAAIWVHLNRISGANRPNPFRELVCLAKLKQPTIAQQVGGAQ
jgi:hypothetical protein